MQHKPFFKINISGAKKTLKFALVFASVVLFFLKGNTQGIRTNHWTFAALNGFDFSSGSPVPDTSSALGGGCGSISDLNGNLVCYSNGSKIWQADGLEMQGGTGLAGSSMATQAAIIIPSVTSSTRYYVFVNGAQSLAIPLNYYDVEMTLNSGNGAVIGPTLLLNPSTEKLCATRHGNDRDYWVVAHKYNSDEFHAFLIDENGVNTVPVISAVGNPHLSSAGGGEYQGAMKISPDGQWLITCTFASGNVQLFRFNNETGAVSDPLTLASGITNFPYGAEFSADSKKVFFSRKASNASNPFGVHQFDLDHVSTDCLLASEQIVSNGNEFKPYADLQLGLDKVIYMFPVNTYIPTLDTISALTQPENMCPDCGFEDLHITTINYITGGGVNFVSSFLSDGITYEFGTNCEFSTTLFTPEDTLGLDSVNWNFGDPLSASNTSNLLNAGHVFSSPDTFLVTLFAFRGTSIDTFTRNVIIWDVDFNLLGNDTTICNGQPITLDGSWYDACVEWNDGSTNNTLAVSTAGVYWVDISYQSCLWRDSIDVLLINDPPQFTLGNDTLVCSNASFEIDPDLPNAYYTWQDGSHDTTFSVSSTGTYWLAATNACGTTSDTINVSLNQSAQPVLELPADTTLCETSELILDVTFDDAVYIWSDGFNGAIKTITESGTYSVTVGNICDTVSDTINVQFQSAAISNLMQREVICSDSDTIALLATTDSLMVEWSDNTFSNIKYVTSAGTYSYSFENTCGVLRDTISIISWQPDYSLNIGNDTTLCSDEIELIIGDFTQDFPWIYRWNTNEKTPTISVGIGEYNLTVNNRCADSTYQLSVIERPDVFISQVIDRTICEGDSIKLSLTDRNLQDIQWSTGAVTNEITALEPGLYSVNLIDSFGCSQEDSLTLNDLCPGIVNVSNVFSPNGDGTNDEFCITLENILTFNFLIFDRWGSEAFSSENDVRCWDGHIKGQDAVNGTYYYIVEVEDLTNEKASFRGSFTLLR